MAPVGALRGGSVHSQYKTRVPLKGHRHAGQVERKRYLNPNGSFRL